MRKILIYCIALLAAVGLRACSSNAPVQSSTNLKKAAGERLKLTGSFIQLNETTQNLKPNQWQEFLPKAYTEAGMDTIIIQRLGFRDKEIKPHTYIKLKSGAIDPDNLY